MIRNAAELLGFANTFPNDPCHLPVVGESAEGTFREHKIPIHRDLEDPVLALDQLNRGTKLVLQLSCQPGSPRLVVSNYAVFDRNIHTLLHVRKS